jgi:hypothetical protein
MNNPVTMDEIEEMIYRIRGHKVLLDKDLAILYQVTTKALNRQVKRNAIRFPDDFMFQLTKFEAKTLRSQIGTSNDMRKQGRGGRRYLPLVFTGQGVAMLSSVLKSERAALVNIAIMRAFVRLRKYLAHHKVVVEKLHELGLRVDSHDTKILSILNAIKALIEPSPTHRQAIGFRPKV